MSDSGIKVRRLARSSAGRIVSMATNGGERRRKRSWRQPRQAAGYPPPPPSSAPSASGARELEDPASDAARPTTTRTAEPGTEKKDADPAPARPRDSAESMTEIDGSVMEGVSVCVCW